MIFGPFEKLTFYGEHPLSSESSYAHIWTISVRKSTSACTTTNNTGLIPNMRPDSMEIPILRKSDDGTSHSSITPRSCREHEIKVNVQRGQKLGIRFKNSNVRKNGLTIQCIDDSSQLAHYVKVGDHITKVNNKNVRNMSAAKVIDMPQELENMIEYYIS